MSFILEFRKSEFQVDLKFLILPSSSYIPRQLTLLFINTKCFKWINLFFAETPLLDTLAADHEIREMYIHLADQRKRGAMERKKKEDISFALKWLSNYENTRSNEGRWTEVEGEDATARGRRRKTDWEHRICSTQDSPTLSSDRGQGHPFVYPVPKGISWKMNKSSGN